MRVLLFIALIVVCVVFIAHRWHVTLKNFALVRDQDSRQETGVAGFVLGCVWLATAIGLGLSAIYFYDRNVSPFFWLMVIVAVNGLGMLALQEFFPDIRNRRQSKG